MRKLKLLLAICTLFVGGGNFAWGQASYNHIYTEGVTVAAGGNYFLYNIGSKRFLTDGMDYGTHASADHAGRVITLAAATNGYSIYTRPYSANGSAEKAGYMTLNGYIDTGTNDADWVFTPVDVDGYTNAYTIKNSDTEYLIYETKDALYQGKMGPFISVGNSTGDSYSYWLLIPMSARQTVGDCTYLLRNGDFNHPWELPMWTNAAGWTNIAGGKKENPCAEMYGKGFDISQTISATITNGRYKLSNQAFYNNADENNQTYLYANSDQSAIAILNANGEGTSANMTGASDAFTAGQYVNSVETFVSDGSLKVGIKNATSAGNAWNIMNNFHLEYLGQCVMDYAVELPDGGAMTADTWYYFDIDVAGDEYTATAATLGDIICVTDGYTLTSATEGTVTLNNEDNSFSVQRYYVKSSSNNSLVIDIASKTYELGSITAQTFNDGDYVKGLTTFVLTYGDAATNDGSASLAVIGSPAPVATLKKNGSAIATGTLSANNAAKTLTATFSDVSLTLNSTDYSIEIAAGVFGYAGQSVNAAITVNFNTPIFADGDYYLKNKGNDAYFAAGNNWGTHAISNDLGHKVTLTAQPNGKYTVNTYIYNGATKHFLNGEYCDGDEAQWSFVPSDTYYQINNGTNNLTAGASGENLSLTAGTGDNTKWSLLTPVEWKTENVLRLDAATAEDGVDATFYIAAPNFNRNDNDENSKWNGSPKIDGLSENSLASNFNAEKYNTTFDVYQEITGMKPGNYKVTMHGFYRNGTTNDQNAILYANSYEVLLMNIKTDGVASQDDAHGFTTENGDVWVPNKQDQAAKTFNYNKYNNELLFTVGAAGTLRIGVKKSTSVGSDWTVIDNFKLTYYGVKEVAINEASDYTPVASEYANVTLTRTFSNTNWNTFVVPFDIDNATLEAKLGTVEVAEYSEASADPNDATVTFTKMATPAITANKPVLLKTSTAPASVTFNGVQVKTGDAKVAGTNFDFVGSYDASKYVTTGNYYLYENKLYKSAKDNGSFIKGTRAYIEAKTPGARIVNFSIDGDETTGIENFTPAVFEDDGAIYNLNGQKVQKAQKGLFIQNGKKLIVK